MALVKAQASCMHLRKLPDKNERVLKYAQATVKVGKDVA
jgi:hypothetical protein